MNGSSWILAHEPLLRLGAFFGVLAALALWEIARPFRAPSLSRARRWSANLGLVVVDSLAVRLLFPAAAVGMAAFVEAQGWGLFQFLRWPLWLTVPLAVVALDLVIYLQHVLVHAVPLLWRLHRVHHADLEVDVTTGLRFHPLEILLSMLIKFAAIVVLGAPVLGVLTFEVVLNAMAMFSHTNVHLPATLDRRLRWLLVTPDMHRIHHSIERDETNSNFGFNLSLWDRLLGTYRAQSRAGDQGLRIGVRELRDVRQVASLPGLLALPFRR